MITSEHLKLETQLRRRYDANMLGKLTEALAQVPLRPYEEIGAELGISIAKLHSARAYLEKQGLKFARTSDGRPSFSKVKAPKEEYSENSVSGVALKYLRQMDPALSYLEIVNKVEKETGHRLSGATLRVIRARCKGPFPRKRPRSKWPKL